MKFVSGSHYPTLSKVVGIYNLHLEKMENFTSDRTDMEQANKAAYEKLKKYYAKFDDTHAYTIATGESLLPLHLILITCCP